MGETPFATWLYVSRCTFAEQEGVGILQEIVSTARSRNAELNVTGALIFDGSHFVQNIEGPSTAIAALRTSIKNDPRHSDLQTFDLQPVGTRRFGTWSLAYGGPSVVISRTLHRALRPDEPGGIALNSDQLVALLLNTAVSKTS